MYGTAGMQKVLWNALFGANPWAAKHAKAGSSALSASRRRARCGCSNREAGWLLRDPPERSAGRSRSRKAPAGQVRRGVSRHPVAEPSCLPHRQSDGRGEPSGAAARCGRPPSRDSGDRHRGVVARGSRLLGADGDGRSAESPNTGRHSPEELSIGPEFKSRRLSWATGQSGRHRRPRAVGSPRATTPRWRSPSIPTRRAAAPSRSARRLSAAVGLSAMRKATRFGDRVTQSPRRTCPAGAYAIGCGRPNAQADPGEPSLLHGSSSRDGVPSASATAHSIRPLCVLRGPRVRTKEGRSRAPFASLPCHTSLIGSRL